MQRFAQILILPLMLLAPEALGAEAYTLKTEFSKNPVYEGESTTAKFILYGTSSFVEAEVAKFPEFRGFWTQNHVLRQGPLPLVVDPGSQQPNQALIGSYTITPMVGKKSPEIVPMKMVIRSHDFFSNDSPQEGMEIWSDKEQLQVLPLPPLPAEYRGKFFGAVGSLAAFSENESAQFRVDEPLTIRIAVRGNGNFPDITEMNTPWTDRVHVLSKRTFQETSLPPTKIFEYTIAVKGEEALTLPPAELVFFHPPSKQYMLSQTQPISLELQPPIPLEISEPDVFGSPATAEQTPLNWATNPFFWLTQIALAAFFLTVLGFRWVRTWAGRPMVQFRSYLKRQNQQLSQALQTENPSLVLRLLESLLMRGNPAEKNRPLSHRKRLEQLGKTWSPDATEQAQWVFETWDQGYAPPEKRPATAPPSRLRQAASRIVKAFRRH
jgi:hypothetical protein